MLETVDFSREPLSKDAYKARRDELMERLVVLQQQARVQGVGLVVMERRRQRQPHLRSHVPPRCARHQRVRH